SWTPTYFNFNGGQGAFNDKPMITVDNSPGPHFGTIYVAWDNNNGNSNAHNQVLVSRSTDGGVTFSAPVVASGNPSGPQGVIGADPYVTPNGTLHVAWKDADNNRIAESSSTDGGLAFGPVHTVATTKIPFDVDIPAEQSRGALMYPACGAVSDATLACSFTDGSLAGGTDVLVSRSTDGGATWSQPARTNDTCGGANLGDQYGDYEGIAAMKGEVIPIWTDRRESVAAAGLGEESFTATIRVK